MLALSYDDLDSRFELLQCIGTGTEITFYKVYDRIQKKDIGMGISYYNKSVRAQIYLRFLKGIYNKSVRAQIYLRFLKGIYNEADEWSSVSRIQISETLKNANISDISYGIFEKIPYQNIEIPRQEFPDKFETEMKTKSSIVDSFQESEINLCSHRFIVANNL